MVLSYAAPRSRTPPLPAAPPPTRLAATADLRHVAFARALAPYQASLTALARRLCRRRADADDLLQDTLLRAYFAFGSSPGDTLSKAWLATIMRNLFIDQCRHRARVRLDGDAHLSLLPAPNVEEPAAWRTIEFPQLERALDSIEPDLREAFILRWREQRSYREIASALRIPVNTVGTRLLRARRTIRERLEQVDAC
jgi:RNA polymerase sigma-70 factor (ECF subfamily)